MNRVIGSADLRQLSDLASARSYRATFGAPDRGVDRSRIPGPTT
jgi:hypothetical protein